MIPNVLTIAGSDSGGGAGIQADLKTFSALRTYGASVITALTAQNTKSVLGIHEVPPGFVEQQLAAVFSDIRIDAVKIGMLQGSAVIETVSQFLAQHDVSSVVVDPVMVAKSGDRLLAANAVATMRRVLLPLAAVVTPNLPEAGDLLERPAPSNEREMVEAGRALLGMGPCAVLMKGGHLDGDECIDLLIDHDRVVRFTAPRTKTTNTHGTGCTISSAIAAMLGHGRDLEAAVREAKRYVSVAIAASGRLSVGQGCGPVHHFADLWGVSGA